jgi:DNA processing protein
MQELGPLAAELQMEIRQRLEQFNDAVIESDSKPVRHKNKLLDDSDYSAVWEVLGYDPKPVDTIIGQSGLSAREVSSMLLMMELKGMVKKHANGRFCRA